MYKEFKFNIPSLIFAAVIAFSTAGHGENSLIDINGGEIPFGLCDIHMQTPDGKFNRGQGTIIGDQLISVAHVINGDSRITQIICSNDVNIQRDQLAKPVPHPNYSKRVVNDIGYIPLRENYQSDISMENLENIDNTESPAPIIDQYMWIRFHVNNGSPEFSMFSLDSLTPFDGLSAVNPEKHVTTEGPNGPSPGDFGGAVIRFRGYKTPDGSIKYKLTHAGVISAKYVQSNGATEQVTSIFERTSAHLDFINQEEEFIASDYMPNARRIGNARRFGLLHTTKTRPPALSYLNYKKKSDLRKPFKIINRNYNFSNAKTSKAIVDPASCTQTKQFTGKPDKTIPLANFTRKSVNALCFENSKVGSAKKECWLGAGPGDEAAYAEAKLLVYQPHYGVVTGIKGSDKAGACTNGTVIDLIRSLR